MDPNVVEIVPLDTEYCGKLPTWLVERAVFLSIGREVKKWRASPDLPEGWIRPPEEVERIQVKLRSEGQLYNSGYLEYTQGKGIVHRDWPFHTVLATPGMRYVNKWLHVWTCVKAQAIKDTYMHCNVCYSYAGNPVVNFLDAKVTRAIPKGSGKPYLPEIVRPGSWIEVNENSSQFLSRLGVDASKWAREMVKLGVVPPTVDATPGERFQGWLCNLIEAARGAGSWQQAREMGYHPIEELLDVFEIDRREFGPFVGVTIQGTSVVYQEIIHTSPHSWSLDSFRYTVPCTDWYQQVPTHFMKLPSAIFVGLQARQKK